LPRRDRLETYIDILKMLAVSGPMKITHLSQRVNVNTSVLKECLEFCEKQNLVEKRKIGKRAVYEVNPRGLQVLEYFHEIRGVLQSVEKGQSIPLIAYEPRKKVGVGDKERKDL
jgi:predicted transcriptional regulator